MKLKRVTFNDFDLSQIMFIDNFRKNLYGQENIVVEIDFTIIGQPQDKIDMLNRVLHTREPKILTYNNLPNRQLLCQLSGEIELEEFKDTVRGTITFVSVENYWRSTQGLIGYNMDNEGRFIIDNKGTAPTVPQFKFTFKTEAGFLGVVAPNGYKNIGNPDEKDKLDIPEQEVALNEEMHQNDMADWDRMTTNDYDWKLVEGVWHSHPPEGKKVEDTLKGLWVPDYNKLNIGTGDPKFTEWGIGLQKSNRPKPGSYWNAWGYRTLFNAGIGEKGINNSYRLDSRISFEDNGGDTNGTGMFLIILMDTNNKPIMTTSIYNVDANNNAANFSAKVNTLTGDRTSSVIIKEARFPNGFKGGVRMEKEGSRFKWIWDSQKDQGGTSSTTQVVENFNVGNTVYIKNTASHYYHYDGTRYPVAGFTRGRPHKVTNKRTRNGTVEYELSYQGVAIAWLLDRDVTGNRSGVGRTQTQAQKYNTIEQVSFTSPELARLTPWKLIVIGGTWDNSRGFTHGEITSNIMYRINGPGKFKDVKNQFQPGDVVEIDNKTGQILHNGFTYQGFADYDNTNFDIDFGPNELKVVTSDWAELPAGLMMFEERYR